MYFVLVLFFVTIVLCCLLHCYTYHSYCSFILGSMCIGLYESVFSLLTILCCPRISLQLEIWSSYSPPRDANTLTHTASNNTHRHTFSLTLSHTQKRALDAGPRALDAGPRALHAGPRALDAGPPRWAARWMPGRVDAGPHALDGPASWMPGPASWMPGRARWMPGRARLTVMPGRSCRTYKDTSARFVLPSQRTMRDRDIVLRLMATSLLQRSSALAVLLQQQYLWNPNSACAEAGLGKHEIL